MKQTATEWLIDMLVKENEVTLKGENYKLFEQAKEIEENLTEQYAEFSILCDRRGMNPVKFNDWCKQFKNK